MNAILPKAMNLDIDADRVESWGKVLLTIAAAWALLVKVCKPLCKWFKDQIHMGARIDALLQPISDIRSQVMILTAREQLKFENSPIPSYECDSTGACIAVNPAWCKLFGVTEHNMLGNGWLDVIADPQERERVYEDWQSSVKNRYPHRERYRGRNYSTGETVWCESATVECTDKNRVPILYCGTIKQLGPDWTPLP